mgnify:CR=1 FL=1
MRIDVKVGRVRSGVTVVGAFEGDAHPDRLVPGADRALRSLVNGSGFRGAANETALLPQGKDWTLVVGLGKSKDLSLERVRQFAGTAARAVRARGFTRLTLPVLSDSRLGGDTAAVAQALAEGALLGLYRYTQLKKLSKSEQRQRIEGITLAATSSRDAAAARQAVRKAEAGLTA